MKFRNVLPTEASTNVLLENATKLFTHPLMRYVCLTSLRDRYICRKLRSNRRSQIAPLHVWEIYMTPSPCGFSEKVLILGPFRSCADDWTVKLAKYKGRFMPKQL